MLKATGSLKSVQCYFHEIYKRYSCQQQLQQGLATLSNSDTIKENVLITLLIIPRIPTALIWAGHVNLHTVEPCYTYIRLYNTTHIASVILWYQFIPYC